MKLAAEGGNPQTVTQVERGVEQVSMSVSGEVGGNTVELLIVGLEGVRWEKFNEDLF